MPDLVQFSPSGMPETVRYHFLVPLLLNELQKQDERIAQQQLDNAALCARLERLERAIEDLQAKGQE